MIAVVQSIDQRWTLSRRHPHCRKQHRHQIYILPRPADKRPHSAPKPQNRPHCRSAVSGKMSFRPRHTQENWLVRIDAHSRDATVFNPAVEFALVFDGFVKVPDFHIFYIPSLCWPCNPCQSSRKSAPMFFQNQAFSRKISQKIEMFLIFMGLPSKFTK